VATASTIVVIGTSAGGVTALQNLMLRFEAEWLASVFVTVHIGRNSNRLPEILSRVSPLPVSLAQHDVTFGNEIYIAPPDRHLLIGKEKTFLGDGPRENHVRPAIDPMFRSAAEHHGARVIAVLLTGYLSDGVNGLFEAHAAGGCTIVQHPQDAEVPEIPLNALRRLTPDYVLPLSEIPKVISQEMRARLPQPTRRIT
jgi:two-component system, chemotaxis family, protein-glutamate methylesterase/glutaminase